MMSAPSENQTSSGAQKICDNTISSMVLEYVRFGSKADVKLKVFCQLMTIKRLWNIEGISRGLKSTQIQLGWSQFGRRPFIKPTAWISMCRLSHMTKEFSYFIARSKYDLFGWIVK